MVYRNSALSATIVSISLLTSYSEVLAGRIPYRLLFLDGMGTHGRIIKPRFQNFHDPRQQSKILPSKQQIIVKTNEEKFQPFSNRFNPSKESKEFQTTTRLIEKRTNGNSVEGWMSLVKSTGFFPYSSILFLSNSKRGMHTVSSRKANEDDLTIGQRFRKKEMALNTSDKDDLTEKAKKLEDAINKGIIKTSSPREILTPFSDNQAKSREVVQRNCISTFLKYKDMLGPISVILYDVGKEFIGLHKDISNNRILAKLRDDVGFNGPFAQLSYKWRKSIEELEHQKSQQLTETALDDLMVSKHNVRVLIHEATMNFYTKLL